MAIACTACGRLDFVELSPSALGEYAGPSDDFGRDVVAITGGDFAVGVQFAGAITIAGEVFVPTGDSNALVMRLDPSGRLRWAHPVSGPGVETVAALSSDAAGNVYLMGSSTGPVDCGEGARSGAGGTTAWLCSYAPDGTPSWTLALGGAASGSVDSITGMVSANDTLYVIGNVHDVVDFGGGPVAPVSATSDAFIAAYAPRDGSLLDVVRYGATGFIGGRRLDSDRRGNLLASFTLGGTADLGGGPIIADLSGDLVIAAFDAALGLRWATLVAADGTLSAGGLVADDTGVYVSGLFSATMRFPATSIQIDTAATNAGYLAATSLEGSPRWLRRFDTPSCSRFQKLAFDRRGRLLVSGAFEGETPTGIPAVGTDGLVAAYGTDGVLESIATQGGTGNDGTVAAADNGTLVIATGASVGVTDACMQAGTQRDLVIETVVLP